MINHILYRLLSVSFIKYHFQVQIELTSTGNTLNKYL